MTNLVMDGTRKKLSIYWDELISKKIPSYVNFQKVEDEIKEHFGFLRWAFKRIILPITVAYILAGIFFFGEHISKILEEQGVELLYSDIANQKEARKLSKNLSEDLYWTYNKEIIGAIEIYRPYIDGIIYLMVFPCGPDALVINLCQNKIKDIPSAVITLDELQGEAGLKTRLESFADILKIRKEKQNAKN